MVIAKWSETFNALPKEVVKRVGDNAHFATATNEKDVIEIVTKAGQDSNFGATINTKAVSGTDLDTLKTAFPNIKYDSGKVFKVIAANTSIDRDTERFSFDVLNLFAQQINKIPVTVLWQHDRETHGLGKMFGGSVVQMSGGSMGYDFVAYLLISNEARIPEQGERKLAPAVEDDYVTNVSIGFRAWGSYKEEQVNGENRYVYTYGIDNDRPETRGAYIREISFVDFGAQVGAAVIKSAKDIEFIKESKETRNMAKTIEIEVGGVKHALTIDVSGDTITVKGDAELNTAIKAASDAATTKATDLQKAVDALRAPLEADVVNAKLVGIDEATTKAFTPEKLIEVAKEVTKGVKVEAVKTVTDPQKYPQIFKAATA
jgi:hypothetical protein